MSQRKQNPTTPGGLFIVTSQPKRRKVFLHQLAEFYFGDESVRKRVFRDIFRYHLTHSEDERTGFRTWPQITVDHYSRYIQSGEWEWRLSSGKVPESYMEEAKRILIAGDRLRGTLKLTSPRVRVVHRGIQVTVQPHMTRVLEGSPFCIRYWMKSDKRPADIRGERLAMWLAYATHQRYPNGQAVLVDVFNGVLHRALCTPEAGYRDLIAALDALANYWDAFEEAMGA